MFLSRLLTVLLCAAPVAAASHELWIESSDYQIESGDQLQAVFKNGENFEGSTLSYFDRSAKRFELRIGDRVVRLAPRSGDNPALNLRLPIGDALVSVVYETTPAEVTYSDWAKFKKFIAHKDFATAEADHAAAGWSKEKFRESYTRHAKALMAVGSGAGSDTEAGLETEFVALSNPYAAGFNNRMKVSLLYEGAPRADAQVEVFDRAPDDSVTVTLHRTDADGVATIPVTAGHEYLFDAVVLRPAPQASTEENAVVWETLWAALTFDVPE
ncbi:DUF4198 domain containing protein [Sulfitobacter noctilucae]|uniref:DUF4198 domain-containing protein n=1 Tax=Sulfitobacter noctilucae TaxID=1342302 RepID=UPI0004693419|nr:DUF4198 domain-containing protein [Sulfitobacter noctilucae]KIN61001.1 DUF4198 domain containing protein [Sulfitobacter noctilucae]